MDLGKTRHIISHGKLAKNWPNLEPITNKLILVKEKTSPHFRRREGGGAYDEYPVYHIVNSTSVAINGTMSEDEDAAPPPEIITCRLNDKAMLFEVDNGCG